MRKLILILVCIGLLSLPLSAMADSITPSTVTATIAVGETLKIHKAVTVSAGIATTRGDIFFLSDTTGSMGTAIGAVKTGASAIMAATAGFGDIAWGVGEYKDVGDPFVYLLNQGITTTQASVQAGINMWSASGGGDGPEGQIPALYRVATQAATNWRSGSEKILVWFGDYEAHNPRDGVSKDMAIAALVAAGIQVEAISVGANRLNIGNIATDITTATGGHYYSGINQAAIVAAIQAALETAFSEYSKVELSPDLVAGLDISVIPLSIIGDFDRSIERIFEFDVYIKGLAPGSYSFNIGALVDGGLVASEADRITVTGGAVPEPATMILIGSGLLGIAWLRKRFKK